MTRAAALPALALASCLAGDGSSLDELGVPVHHPDYPSLATFEGADFPPELPAIQRFFFDPHCIECHGSVSAAKDLSLVAGSSYGNLVDVPAVERPDLVRVRCGQPDRSYLVMKLKGQDGIVGRQMPRRRPPRPQAEIDVIRSWIEQGCPVPQP